MGKTRKTRKTKKTRKTYNKKHYKSNEGMLTTVWGPLLWTFLHTISFNYPVKPSRENKQKYREFIYHLQYILPCRYCRDNIKKNLTVMPLKMKHMKNRERFSRWMFNFHELVNKMLKKNSGLTYCEIRDRYEHFRSRCTEPIKTIKTIKTIKKIKKEKGCVEPLYGEKSKCVVHIVPSKNKCKTFKMDKKCIKKRSRTKRRKVI